MKEPEKLLLLSLTTKLRHAEQEIERLRGRVKELDRKLSQFDLQKKNLQTDLDEAYELLGRANKEVLRALVQVKKEIRLPTFEECKSHLKDGLTALEVLIYDNEPAGTEDSERFREQLLCALREVLSLAKEGKE